MKRILRHLQNRRERREFAEYDRPFDEAEQQAREEASRDFWEGRS